MDQDLRDAGPAPVPGPPGGAEPGAPPAGADLAGLFKGAFRRYPTGVAVISAAGPEGPVGLTASSVASVSLAPPALSFSVLATRSARALLAAPSFVVHLLGPAHAALAREFARTGGARFTPDQGWGTLPTGEPILPGALAALRGTPLHRVPVGESTLVVANVVEVFHGPDDGRLVHHAGRFSAFGVDIVDDGTPPHHEPHHP